MCYKIWKILNLKDYTNCIIGSKVTVILLNVWILPIGGLASVRVCGFSLSSRIVLYLSHIRTYYIFFEITHNTTFNHWSNQYNFTNYKSCHILLLEKNVFLGPSVELDLNPPRPPSALCRRRARPSFELVTKVILHIKYMAGLINSHDLINKERLTYISCGYIILNKFSFRDYSDL